jgi:hypothetical protein
MVLTWLCMFGEWFDTCILVKWASSLVATSWCRGSISFLLLLPELSMFEIVWDKWICFHFYHFILRVWPWRLSQVTLWLWVGVLTCLARCISARHPSIQKFDMSKWKNIATKNHLDKHVHYISNISPCVWFIFFFQSIFRNFITQTITKL